MRLRNEAEVLKAKLKRSYVEDQARAHLAYLVELVMRDPKQSRVAKRLRALASSEEVVGGDVERLASLVEQEAKSLRLNAIVLAIALLCWFDAADKGVPKEAGSLDWYESTEWLYCRDDARGKFEELAFDIRALLTGGGGDPETATSLLIKKVLRLKDLLTQLESKIRDRKGRDVRRNYRQTHAGIEAFYRKNTKSGKIDDPNFLSVFLNEDEEADVKDPVMVKRLRNRAYEAATRFSGLLEQTLRKFLCRDPSGTVLEYE